jgi:serine/threonine protein kinase
VSAALNHCPTSFPQILLLESCHKSGELVRITPSLHTACIPEVLSAIHKAEASSSVDRPTVNASLEMDVWSYGCILYQVFTGRKLFSGPSSAMIEVIQNAETFRVPPEELGDVIAK